MNINENLKNRAKTNGFTNTRRGDKTYIESLGAFLIDVKLSNEKLRKNQGGMLTNLLISHLLIALEYQT